FGIGALSLLDLIRDREDEIVLQTVSGRTCHYLFFFLRHGEIHVSAAGREDTALKGRGTITTVRSSSIGFERSHALLVDSLSFHPSVPLLLNGVPLNPNLEIMEVKSPRCRLAWSSGRANGVGRAVLLV